MFCVQINILYLFIVIMYHIIYEYVHRVLYFTVKIN